MLATTSLAVVGLAVALPFSPLATALGFVPLPLDLLLTLAALVAVYLVVVERAKRRFYRRFAANHALSAQGPG